MTLTSHSQTRDEAFEREEIKFRNLEKAVKIFHRSVIQYLNDSQVTTFCLLLAVRIIVFSIYSYIGNTFETSTL